MSPEDSSPQEARAEAAADPEQPPVARSAGGDRWVLAGQAVATQLAVARRRLWW